MTLHIKRLNNCGARLSVWVLNSVRMMGKLEGDKVSQQVHRSVDHWGRVPWMSIPRKGEGLRGQRQYDLPDVVLDPDGSGRNDQETETDISQELNHITWPQKQRQILSLLQWTTGKPHASCKSKVRMPDLRKSLNLDNNWRAKVSEQLKVGRKFNFNCLVLIHRPHFLCPYWKMTFGNTHGPLYLAAAGILQIHFVFSLWINTGGNYTLSGRSRIASAIEAVYL